MIEDEFISIDKMTYIPKIQKNRGHGWFYRRPGIGRLMEEDRRRTWVSYSPSWPRFYGYHQFDKAHLVMLLEEQIIPRDEGIQCLRALRMMESEGIDQARQQIGGIAHSGEAYLTMKLGWWTGGWIHAGRSSHDLNTVNQRITQRNYILDVMDNVNNLRETLITLSEQHVNTIMPYWSHGQRGRPVTLAFYFMTWVKMLERDFERLVLCYKHTNISPAGTSEGTGTDFPLNPRRTAELLGFDAVYENANDMWLTDDFRIEAFATLITIGAPLRRLGEDLQLWSGWEYRIADLADRWCGTSSIMAHKKNPHAIYTLPIGERSAKTRIHSGSAEEFAIAVRDIIDSLQIAREILQTTSWNTDRMIECCHSGWLCIPDLARSLCVSKGLPWRIAHQICATLVRLATEEGKLEQDVTPALLDRAAIAYPAFGQPLNVSEQLIRDALNPVNSIHARIVHGSTNPLQVHKQITSSQETLLHDRQITTLKRTKLQDAEQLLETSITRLLSN